jgi:hypothetical protein
VSEPPKKSGAKKASATNSSTASVRDVVARASHLREVAAILRAGRVEFVTRFNGVGRDLPELLLQRDGQGARPATIEAILEVESSLEGIAHELEARADALLSTHVDSEALGRVHETTGIGVDQVVHRDRLDPALRPRSQKMPMG